MTFCIALFSPRFCRQVRGMAASIAFFLAVVCLGKDASPTPVVSAKTLGAPLETTEYDEPSIKAALLIKLTPFFRWPDMEDTETNRPMRIGVLGRNPFGDSLNDLTKARTNSGRAFQVTYGSKPEQLKGCQVIFIASEPPPNWAEIRRVWEAKPVLLMGDQPDFIEQGGMVNLLIRQQKPFLQIKRRTIEKAGLKVKALLDNTKRIEWIP